jgi:hypothetical protein
MANTSTRTLRPLSLLRTHRYWPGTELAERLGVSIRTLRQAVDRFASWAIRSRRSAESPAATGSPPAPHYRRW